MKLSLVQNVPQKYSLIHVTQGTNQWRPNLNMKQRIASFIKKVLFGKGRGCYLKEKVCLPRKFIYILA